MIRGIRPIWREWLIAWYRWALADMQRTNANHRDLPEVVLRLRTLLDERAADRPSLVRKVWQWL